MRKNRTYRLYCPNYDLDYQSTGRLGSAQNYNDLMVAQSRRYSRYSYISTWEDYKRAVKGATWRESICRVY